MTLETLHELYVHELKDVYDAATQILVALPKWSKAAVSPALARAFGDRVAETRRQINRLTSICDELKVKPQGLVCQAMCGLIAEGDEVMEYVSEPTVLDAALITVAQRIGHYQIANYGCVRNFAGVFGYGEAAYFLQESLDEEMADDERLTKLAEAILHAKTASATA